MLRAVPPPCAAVWENGGGSTTDFKLQPKLAEAMAAATKNGKKVMLSIGGEVRPLVHTRAARVPVPVSASVCTGVSVRPVLRVYSCVRCERV